MEKIEMGKGFFYGARLLFLMSLIFLSACQTSKSVIFSNLCAAPCWRNIEPGKTTSSEALEMIRKFRGISILPVLV